MLGVCQAYTHNLSSTLDGLTLLDQSVGTEKHNTDLAGFEVHAHALDAGGEPECSLVRCCHGDIHALYVLDQLLSLDIAHAIDTCNTVTFARISHCTMCRYQLCSIVPDSEDTASLGETGLLLHATDSLLEDGRDLSGRGLGVGGIATVGVDNGGCGALLSMER